MNEWIKCRGFSSSGAVWELSDAAGEQGPMNLVHLSVVTKVSPSDNFTDLLMGTRLFSEVSSGPYKDVNVLQNPDE